MDSARRRNWVFTNQTWVAVAAAGVLVAMVLVLAVVPVPFVRWSPGGAWDLLGKADSSEGAPPMIQVSEAQTFPTTGKLLLLTISESQLDATISLPEALFAHWMPNRDAMPRSLLVQPGKTSSQVAEEDRVKMDSSQRDAIVAALHAANLKVDEHPQVAAVRRTGPSFGKLKEGDYIWKADGKPVTTEEQVDQILKTKKVNERLAFTVIRDNRYMSVFVTVVAGNQQPGQPVIGVRFEPGYRHQTRVKFNIAPRIGGPSGGLMFALALYDKLTSADVTHGKSIAGTGELNEQGVVGRIGGVQEKIGAAEAAGADIFLVPAPNCHQLQGIHTDMRIVKVTTFSDALTSLEKLADPAKQAEVPGC